MLRSAKLIVSVKPLKGFKQPNSLDLTLRTALPTVTGMMGLAGDSVETLRGPVSGKFGANQDGFPGRLPVAAVRGYRPCIHWDFENQSSKNVTILY